MDHAKPLQFALAGRPSALSKLAPNSFVPGGARQLLLADAPPRHAVRNAPGDAHFTHASRLSASSGGGGEPHVAPVA